MAFLSIYKNTKIMLFFVFLSFFVTFLWFLFFDVENTDIPALCNSPENFSVQLCHSFSLFSKRSKRLVAFPEKKTFQKVIHFFHTVLSKNVAELWVLKTTAQNPKSAK